jgi:D-inositol-3-phosphate glycosyltransferase
MPRSRQPARISTPVFKAVSPNPSVGIVSSTNPSLGGFSPLNPDDVARPIAVSLLTGGSDKPYVFGITTELLSKGAVLDVIGSDELDGPEFHGKPGLNFFNLRGDQGQDASFSAKVLRILKYYAALMLYAAKSKPRIFHILWNNKFETFDRTLLTLYYKLLGKKVVLTAHNVNFAKRDSRDSILNRLTLRIQYRLADHIFVHTEKMKSELLEEFDVRGTRVTVIPFGINNAVPHSALTPKEARESLGIRQGQKTILFFGRITPYKGLEYLIGALRLISKGDSDYRLLVAGRPDRCEDYWKSVQDLMQEDLQNGRVVLRSEFIPDEETEVYFKAADVLVLPYKNIYQSGVLFLAYSFGLPVLAADVGSLKESIVEGETGFAFKPEDPTELAKAIERYFGSELYRELSDRRQPIKDYARAKHSWDVVGETTMGVYGSLLSRSTSRGTDKSQRTEELSRN